MAVIEAVEHRAAEKGYQANRSAISFKVILAQKLGEQQKFN